MEEHNVVRAGEPVKQRSPEGERLTELLTSLMPALAQYLLRRAPRDDAADLLGETLVVVWRRVSELPADDAQARMWCFGIARGTLLNYARGERRRTALTNRLRTFMGESRSSPAADSGFEVRDAIDSLGQDAAEIIRLAYWDGFTMEEIAQLLDLPVTTVRSRYRRARERLREALSGIDESAGSPISHRDLR